MSPSFRFFLVILAGSCLCSADLIAADYYVCAATGKGRTGSKEKPAKDLGNLIKKLVAGDVVHIAQGVYTGRGDNGSDIINVPVKIIGGYNDDFSKRDPWGAHQTVFSGDRGSENFVTTARLAIDCQKERSIKEDWEILVDGIIVDNGQRNTYAGDKESRIVRKARPGTNPTPDAAAISLVAPTSKFAKGKVTVRNCVVLNAAPTGGALSLWGYQDSEVVCDNNLILNCTGVGIFCHSSFHPRDTTGLPTFSVTNNTVLYIWKYDAYGNINGSGIKFDAPTKCTVTDNVFAVCDNAAIDNIKKSADITLARNLVRFSGVADYIEFNMKMDIDEIEDESDLISDDTMDNVSDEFVVAMPTDWSESYATRTVIDRNKVEAGVEADDTGANALRSMLGLPLQAGDVKADSDIWLHRLELQAGLQVGKEKILGKYGCQQPAAQ